MDTDFLLGMVGILVSALCYGCQFVPIQRYQLGDGLFVQWLKVAGALFTGAILLLVRWFPPFQPMAALGGLIWSTSNACLVPVLSMAGTTGIMVWSSLSLIFGWATARFGWFLLDPEPPASDLGNVFEYVGITLTVLSAIIFAMVGPPPKKHEPNETIKKGLFMSVPVSTISTQGALTDAFITPDIDYNPAPQPNQTWLQRNKIRIVGIVLAAAVSFFNSQAMTPVTYAQERDKHNNMTYIGLDYCYSYSAGAFFGATTYFLIYCVVMKNKPRINPQVALPGIIYGLLWSGGMFAMFFAIGKISQSVSFPICARLPSLIMLLWDIFYFKTLRGKRNLLIMGSGVLVSVIGVTLIGLSKQI